MRQPQLRVAVVDGGRVSVVRPCCGVSAVSGDLGEPAMQLLAQLVGLVLALRPAFAGEQDAGGGDSGKTGEPDQLPARTHRFRRLLGW